MIKLRHRMIAAAAAGFLILALHPQELRHTAGVVNVEVPVRVFDGDRFVDTLGLGDFEVFENGKPQQIVALYLVRKTGVQKEEAAGPAATKPVPKTARSIVLQFEVLDPMPKIDDAIDYFFTEVLAPGDALTVVTPRTSYRFKPEALDRVPRPVIAGQLKGKLRSDIVAGSTEFRRLLDDIRDIIKMPIQDTDLKLRLINERQQQLRDRIGIDTLSLQRLARALKSQEGQKYVFFFYQRELIDSVSFGNFGDESIPVSELQDSADANVRRTSEVNPKAIERMFSDASITAHFIYLTQSRMNAAGLDIEFQRGERSSLLSNDLSASIFGSLREMARTTGGITEASANPFAAFQKAVTASENYYLLYYVPADYQADGKFKEIRVRVKGKGYRVSNRAGYFAN
jgi:VWFA-related protein